jgi:hypothetical protein
VGERRLLGAGEQLPGRGAGKGDASIFVWPVLTEIYLWHACSYHEIEGGNASGRCWREATGLARRPRPRATRGRRARTRSSCWMSRATTAARGSPPSLTSTLSVRARARARARALSLSLSLRVDARCFPAHCLWSWLRFPYDVWAAVRVALAVVGGCYRRGVCSYSCHEMIKMRRARGGGGQRRSRRVRVGGQVSGGGGAAGGVQEDQHLAARAGACPASSRCAHLSAPQTQRAPPRVGAGEIMRWIILRSH